MIKMIEEDQNLNKTDLKYLKFENMKQRLE